MAHKRSPVGSWSKWWRIFLVLGFLFVLPHLASAAEVIEFKQGFNLFQYPVEVPADYTSFDFLLDIHEIGNVVSIQRYNPTTGLFQTTSWHDGAPAGIEFSLKNIEGYFIHTKEDISIDFDGNRACGEVPLHAGFNLIGFPCPPVNYTSADLMVDLGGESAVDRIKKYDPESNSYLTTGWSGGVVSGDVFPITHTEAYLVSMHASSTWGPATGPTYISGVISEDGYVDALDLAIISQNFGSTGCNGDCPGDIDRNGVIDGSDLASFVLDFGRRDIYPCPWANTF
jgi:hypothetical protein